MRSTAILLISFLLSSVFSRAEILTLKGTIGKSKVVMQMDADYGSLSGSYFYEKNCLDIPLNGTFKGNDYTFHAGSAWNDDWENEDFDLTRRGSSLTGKWTYRGKTLTVSLNIIKRMDVVNTYAATNPVFAKEKLSDFEYYRTTLAKFQRIDSTTIINGVTFQWFKETHFDLYIFRAIKGLPMEKIKFLNDYLENLQLVDFSNYGSCGYGENVAGFTGWMSYWFMNKDFFSFRMNYDYFCGGAHPDFHSVFHNLDMNGLKALSTDEILQFPGVVRYDEDINWDEWSAYREEAFAPKIIEITKRLYPENYPEISEEELNEEGLCFYESPDVWQFSDALITEKGLLVSASFARAIRMCDDPDWAVIPYSDVKEWLPANLRTAFLNIR